MKANPIRCLISAGPTREFFDPVRYLTNPSSGKMGYAIATAAHSQGWKVDLVSGPVCLDPPIGVAIHPVITGDDMLESVQTLFPTCDILIMTAAVMDYKPKQYSTLKIKKSSSDLVLEMQPVIDILKTVASGKRDQMVVGFAAETHKIEHFASRKRIEKNCDYIVANRVGTANSGFQADMNTVVVLGPKGVESRFGPAPKMNVAQHLIELFSEKLASRGKGI